MNENDDLGHDPDLHNLMHNPHAETSTGDFHHTLPTAIPR